MSCKTTMTVMIDDLGIFKKVCEWSDVQFSEETLKLTQRGKYLGKLVRKDKKDGGSDGGMSLVTDSDFVGENRRLREYTDLNTVMRDYSEQVCYKLMPRLGTLLKKEESSRGILLKIAVNA